jgi:hypothetical protein
MDVQTVQQVHAVTVLTQHRSQVQETQRLGPEIEGRKIVDVGIDQEDMRGVFHWQTRKVFWA